MKLGDLIRIAREQAEATEKNVGNLGIEDWEVIVIDQSIPPQWREPVIEIESNPAGIIFISAGGPLEAPYES